MISLQVFFFILCSVHCYLLYVRTWGSHANLFLTLSKIIESNSIIFDLIVPVVFCSCMVSIYRVGKHVLYCKNFIWIKQDASFPCRFSVKRLVALNDTSITDFVGLLLIIFP